MKPHYARELVTTECLTLASSFSWIARCLTWKRGTNRPFSLNMRCLCRRVQGNISTVAQAYFQDNGQLIPLLSILPPCCTRRILHSHSPTIVLSIINGCHSISHVLQSNFVSKIEFRNHTAAPSWCCAIVSIAHSDLHWIKKDGCRDLKLTTISTPVIPHLAELHLVPSQGPPLNSYMNMVCGQKPNAEVSMRFSNSRCTCMTRRFVRVSSNGRRPPMNIE